MDPNYLFQFHCHFSYLLIRINPSSCPRFCVLARTQIVRCCCFLSMTKHRTISQQQLHNDVRLVFPRNNCLLKLAALLPSLRCRCQRRVDEQQAALLSFSVCMSYTHRRALVCVGLCACARRCVRALCSIHSNVQREISFQYATRSATRRGLRLRLRLCRSRRRRRSWLWVRYKSISISLSVFVGKKRRTVHTLSASGRRRRKNCTKKVFERARILTVISQSFKLCLC